MALERRQEILEMLWWCWASDTCDVVLLIKVLVQLVYAQVLTRKNHRQSHSWVKHLTVQWRVWKCLKMCCNHKTMVKVFWQQAASLQTAGSDLQISHSHGGPGPLSNNNETWDHTSVPAKWHLILSDGLSRVHGHDRYTDLMYSSGGH